MMKPTSHRRRASGFVLLYAAIGMVALTGLLSLALDVGRVYLVRSELQTAADSAARAALVNLPKGVDQAIQNAKTLAAQNLADGAPVVLLDADIEFGLWDEDDHTFSPLTGANRANADSVRVHAVRSGARNSAVSMVLASALGKPTHDVVAEATVAIEGTASQAFLPAVTKVVPGRASPWNAGVAPGVVWGDFNDESANCAPIRVSEIGITPGQPLLFRSGSGTTQFGNGGSQAISIEGDVNWILDQYMQNGIGRTKAPAHALMGVFINDSDPRGQPNPGTRDYSKANKRNFSSHKPKLRQVFYIGDGKRSDGTYQKFYVPTGATRLYLGTMDEYGRWSDNTGDLSIEVGYPPGQVPSGATITWRTQLVD